MTLKHLRSVFAAGLFSLTAASSCFAAPDLDTKGYVEFDANQFSSAHADFASALKASPQDAAALRGLGWLAFYADDEATALQDWSRSIEAEPAQWQTPGLLTHMYSLQYATGQYGPMVGAAKALLADPNVLPSVKAYARTIIADDLESHGNKSAAQQIRDSLGAVRSWSVVGPFDNVSHSGFAARFAPELHLDPSAAMPGKDGLSITWHHLATVNDIGYCDLSNAVGDNQEDAYYAVTAVHVVAAGRALLGFAPTGASKIWCNGRCVFLDSVYRNETCGDVEPFQVPVALESGWNTILVKACDTDLLGGAFRLRILSSAGTPLSGAVVDPAHVEPFACNESTAPQAADQRIDPSVMGDPVERTLLQSNILSTYGDRDDALAMLHAAVAAAPDCVALHYELSDTLSDDGQLDESAAETNAALHLDPGFPLALSDYLTSEDSGLTDQDALARLKSAVAAHPQSLTLVTSLSAQYSGDKLSVPAISAARKAFALAPGQGPALALCHILDDNDREKEAMAILQKIVKLYPTQNDLEARLASMESNQGHPETAIPRFESLISREGPMITDEQGIVDDYVAEGDAASAIKWLRQLQAHHPEDSAAFEQLGDILEDQGRNADAAAQYRYAIALNPAQVQLREKLQVLQGRKPEIDLVAPLPTPDLAAIAVTKPDMTYGADLIVDDGREVVYPDSSTLMRFHSVIRINTKEGVDRYSEMSLGTPTSTSALTVETAKVYKTDGKTEDDLEHADGSTVSFPSLAPGDVIDLTYRVDDWQSGGLSGNFWSEWFFSELGEPSRISRFALLTPVGTHFDVALHNGAPASVRHISGNWQIDEWRQQNIPANPVESSPVGSLDRREWLDISTVKSWSDIVSWYLALSGPRCVADTAVKAKALQLTNGLSTETDKIHAIVSYVRKLQYQSSPFRNSAFIPTEGKDVIRERYGDCKDKAALLVALLSVVGVHADMALLSPRIHGLTPYLPSPRFDHAIACVATGSGPLWVDATADQMAFSDLPSADQGVQALLITPATTALTTIPPLPEDRSKLVFDVEGALAAAGSLTATAKVVASGNMAWIFRSAFQQVPGNAKTRLLQNLTSGWFGASAHFDDGSIEGADDPDLPLEVDLKFHADDVARAAGNYLLLTLPWPPTLDVSNLDELADPGRVGDLELDGGTSVMENHLNIALPPGTVPDALEPDIDKQSAWAGYRFAYRLDGSSLHVDNTVTQLVMRVPRADVAAYVDFLRGLQKESQNVVLLKKS